MPRRKIVKIQKYRIIPRLEQDCAGNWRPILFFPDESRAGFIGQYTQQEGHGEASLEYYKTTRTANTEALKLATRYAADIAGAHIQKTFKA